MYYHIEKCMESLEPKAPSWTENDLLVLISEYWKRKEILRAKASESVTNLQKRECWIEITEVVNARCFAPHTKKTMDQLKRKWERTIMLAKKAALNIQKRSGMPSLPFISYQGFKPAPLNFLVAVVICVSHLFGNIKGLQEFLLLSVVAVTGC